MRDAPRELGAPGTSGAASASFARTLRSRALQWLAQREHSRAELRRKLLAHAQRDARDARDDRQRRSATPSDVGTKHSHDGSAEEPDELDPAARAAAIESLLDGLEAQRFLCDERFVESRVHARLDRFGNARIRLELARHGVALSPDAERRLRESEFERARSIWLRKYAGTATGPASRARQSRFLAGRGFSAEVISRVLREATRPTDGTDERRDDD